MLRGIVYSALTATMLLQAAELPPQWEILKGVMIAIATAGILWACRTLFVIRDKFIKAEPALKNLNLMVKQIRALQNWRIRIEAVARSERENHPGDERRNGGRRLRDVIAEAQELEVLEVTSDEYNIIPEDE